MGEVIYKYETKYEVGDVVIFYDDLFNVIKVGLIEGYNIDDGYFWFNIRISPSEVYTYSNHRDIPERNIIDTVGDDIKDECLKLITKE